MLGYPNAGHSSRILRKEELGVRLVSTYWSRSPSLKSLRQYITFIARPCTSRCRPGCPSHPLTLACYPIRDGGWSLSFGSFIWFSGFCGVPISQPTERDKPDKPVLVSSNKTYQIDQTHELNQFHSSDSINNPFCARNPYARGLRIEGS